MWVTKGAFAVVDDALDGIHATSEYPTFEPDPHRVDVDFIRWLMSTPQFVTLASAFCNGTTQRARLHPKDFLRLKVDLPPLSEQEKIATILASVDETIEATEAVIEQTRRVKKGLLQELLTRGIGHTEFKKTAIGEIPKGWEVKQIQDLLARTDNPMRSGPFGSALLKSELVDSGIPVLGIDNVETEKFVDEYRRFITQEKFEELGRYQVFPDDVMITIMGTVGRSCVVPDDIDVAISSKHVWTLTFDRERYNPYLACAQINHARWVLQHFEADAQGGTMSAIRSATLRQTRFPVPPIEEQHEIASILESLDDEVALESQRLESLREAKKGILQDLLTGKVRVNVEEAAEDVRQAAEALAE